MLELDLQNHQKKGRMEDVLLKFGVKTGHLITGLVAGIMGLLFNKRPQTLRAKIRSYIVVLSGAVLTGYITPLILLKWDWLSGAEYSVAFVVGLFGMGVIETGFVIVKKLKENPLDTIKNIRNIFKSDS